MFYKWFKVCFAIIRSFIMLRNFSLNFTSPLCFSTVFIRLFDELHTT